MDKLWWVPSFLFSFARKTQVVNLSELNILQASDMQKVGQVPRRESCATSKLEFWVTKKIKGVFFFAPICVRSYP